MLSWPRKGYRSVIELRTSALSRVLTQRGDAHSEEDITCEEELAQCSPSASPRSPCWRPRVVVAAATDPRDRAERRRSTGGEITVRGCTPQNPLIPANTNETCGGNVLDAVTAKLVHYNPDTAAPENDIAAVDRDHRQPELHGQAEAGLQVPGRHRGQGQELRRRLELGRLRPERQRCSYFFEPDRGLRRHCSATGRRRATPTASRQGPKTNKMTGLKVVDDYTFTIKTTEKVSNLPVRLGYTAFAPLPDSFFNDPKAFGEKPIGAGPFKFDSSTRTPRSMSASSPTTRASSPASVDKITFKIYQDDDAAYNDVIANNLDVTDAIPTDRLDRRQVQDRPARPQRVQGRRRRSRRSPSRRSTTTRTTRTSKLRKAISMAIDRRPDHQADLQRHPCRPPPAGSPRSSTATRPTPAASPASSTRPRPRPCSTRPAASRAAR